jgi:hypothetical protein
LPRAAGWSAATLCFGLSREGPAQPIADGFAHDQLKIAAL